MSASQSTLVATPPASVSKAPVSTKLSCWLSVQRFMTRHETVTAGLGESWELFKRLAGEMPVPFLSTALEGVSFVEEKIALDRKNAKDFKELADKLHGFADIVNRYNGEEIVKQQIKTNESSYEMMNILAKKLIDITKKYKDDSTPSAIIKSKKYASDIAGVISNMNDLFAGMMLQSTLANEERTTKVYENQLLEKLPRSLTSDSDELVRKPCHPGTCGEVISSIVNWISAKDGHRIFWLKGPPSSGKTSVITSVIKQIESLKDVVVADFLCTRVLTQSGHANVIMPTLAYNLAEKNGKYRGKLLHCLESLSRNGVRSTIADSSPSQQFDELFLKPLASETNRVDQQQIILIIDSLEECCPDSYSYESAEKVLVTDLLRGLGNMQQASSLKVIISSRMTKVIGDVLDRDTYAGVTTFDMNDYLKSSAAEDDIRAFYEAELKAIQSEFSGKGPSPEDITKLVEITGNSFQVAQTICRAVKSLDPDTSLKNFLQMSAKEIRSLGFQGVYGSVLDDCVKQLRQNQNDLQLFQKAIMTIVLSQGLFSVEELAAILKSTNAKVLRKTLEGLMPIMVVPASSDTYKGKAVQIRPYDTAFIDYMRDKSIDHKGAWINPYVHNCAMASYLLRFLNERLRSIKNLSQFDEIHATSLPSVYRSEQKRLTEAVVYGSRYWMYHITESAQVDVRDLTAQEALDMAKYQTQVIKELQQFLELGRILSWVAVLDRSNIVHEGCMQLRQVKKWLNDMLDTQFLATPNANETEQQWPWLLSRSGTRKRMSPEDRDRMEGVLKQADKQLQYLNSNDYKDQRLAARRDAVMDSDPIPVIRRLTSTQYSDDVRKKAKDLLEALQK